jgi:integron integrase
MELGNQPEKILMIQPPNQLLILVGELLRERNYSSRTIQIYLCWIEQFIHHFANKNQTELDQKDFHEYIHYLSSERNLSISTQNQAISALRFFYRYVLEVRMDDGCKLNRNQKNANLPVVLNRSEIGLLFDCMKGTHKILAQLLYGGGLCLMECLRLRVQDIKFIPRQIIVRDAGGEESRITILPDCLFEPLERHLRYVKLVHEDDLAIGQGSGYPPKSLAVNHPGIEKEFGWQYAFPSSRNTQPLTVDGRQRNHLDASGLQKAIHHASIQAKIGKHVSAQTLRHTFAVHMLESGYDIHTVQALLGHKDISSTMVYKHIIQHDGISIRSPLDLRN